jgi:signal transduction histidine kinase
MTNGSGSQPTPAAGFPVSGGGSAPGGPPAAGQGAPGAGAFGGVPVPANLPAPQARPSGAQAPPAPRRGSPFSISNWRVRWRLIAIITVPTVTALILGVIQIVGSVNNYSSFKRVQDLANLNSVVVKAAGQLADERDDTAGFVAAGGQAFLDKNGQPTASMPVNIKTLYTKITDPATGDQQATNASVAQIQRQAQAVVDDSGYRAQTVLDLSNGVLSEITDLHYIRQAALQTKSPALSAISSYDNVVSAFITFSNDVAAGTGNATLQSDVSVLSSLLRMEDDASLQRAYLYQALASPAPALTPIGLQQLNQAAEEQQADSNAFTQASTVAQQQSYDNVVAGPEVDEAKSAEKRAIASASTPGQTLTIGDQQTCVAAHQGQATCWMTTQTAQIAKMRQVSNGLVADITAQSNTLAANSLHSALVVSIATLILLLVVLLITTFVARSMIRPLRKLRADALEVAGSKLPDMVRRLSESEGGDASAEIEPIGVNSTDEIGEVARAFDQVHREAVRLAADEAMLRGNLNAMFVNLSRRSQSLIERQLSLIDDLEQTEQDADRLSSLFRLDHLATRMRRNSENLLVLAGHEAASRRWSQPVPLVDVLRAAISEIEQYERVVLNVQPGIQVVGQAVNDIVHLVAEIVENATTFSSEDTQVYVTGQPLTSGGVLLDITDNGVGISEQEMAHANWRLDNPPVVDVAVSRRMGLFVVGRLAARHGVRVRLRHAQSGGLTALIWLPESVAMPESGQPLGHLRNFEADDYGPAPSLSAPTVATPLPGSPAGANGLAGAAATASRIPRLGGGAAGNGNGSHGGAPFGSPFGAFGPGSAPARTAPGAPNGAGANGSGQPGPGPNGLSGPPASIDGPGGKLPVRTPGSHPLGPVSQANGGSVFGSDTIGDTDFATTRMPAVGGDGGAAGTGPGIPAGPAAPVNGNGTGGSDGSQVTVPPSVDPRLPIFDSLESDWFRRSGTPASSDTAPAAGQAWNSSPADEGWRAAQVAVTPEAGGNTTAGLPMRVPRANLVPGSVGGGGGEESKDAPPVRSADTIRNRMSSFQRGVREARAVVPQNEEP